MINLFAIFITYMTFQSFCYCEDVKSVPPVRLTIKTSTEYYLYSIVQNICVAEHYLYRAQYYMSRLLPYSAQYYV